MKTAFASLAVLPFTLAAVHQIAVGGDNIFAFNPNNIVADVGDVLSFQFNVKNHTATQSSFASPCTKLLGADNLTPVGFNSGFNPVAAGSLDLPVFNVTVNDSKPIWVYCAQKNPFSHCAEKGMVFAANAPTTGNTFQAFLNNALASGNSTTSTTTTTSATAAWTSPPAPEIVTVTATVTEGDTTYLTTYASWEGSAAPTAAPQPVNHVIVVGGSAGLVFTPSNITASINDTVTFQFESKNHTATQSSFSNPCTELAKTSATGQVGFDSGFMPVGVNDTNFPSLTITVNDTAPIWGYCRQTNPTSHCGSGMVFSINAVEDSPNNFAAFQGLAIHNSGSSASTTSSGSASSPSSSDSGKKSGATRVSLGGASVLVGVVAVVFGMML
ncbi:hypothetical protein SISSUDRAFT_1043623 [Sistotremastrum suecicum HHB10207 ss-3]|uniref:Cupredoxin n=1 Tax=Sistotremastrum suecicum HHB10207 ss-3 TaxID=1314776 RepID=A0A166FPS2_9AGAM|nr:hypothetical protein SISSUDRAFT_1043623 [Sistotremastrum suecicum HHB10207 ss-3]